MKKGNTSFVPEAHEPLNDVKILITYDISCENFTFQNDCGTSVKLFELAQGRVSKRKKNTQISTP